MRTEEIKIYKYSELSDEAKVKARDWYREDLPVDHEFIYDEAVTIAEMMGIEIATKAAKLMNGSTRQEPEIYYTGFWSQGDGASFEGGYRYKKGAFKAIKEYAPEDHALHNIAQALQDVQKKYFYRLTAGISQRGRYYHSGTMYTNCYYSGDDYRTIEDRDCDEIQYQMRAFADWIYNRLRSEYEYQNSDEAVEESIIGNEYEFTEDGSIH